MADPQHHDVRQVPGGFVALTQNDQTHDNNPVVHHLSVFKTRARMLDDRRVEAKAKQLQAASSYEDWDGLSDADKELWRHMARLQLC